jgi:hypothetical protein
MSCHLLRATLTNEKTIFNAFKLLDGPTLARYTITLGNYERSLLLLACSLTTFTHVAAASYDRAMEMFFLSVNSLPILLFSCHRIYDIGLIVIFVLLLLPLVCLTLLKGVPHSSFYCMRYAAPVNRSTATFIYYSRTIARPHH